MDTSDKAYKTTYPNINLNFYVMRKSRILFAGFFVSTLISAFALTKNVDFSAKAFAEEPRVECIKSDHMGGDHTDYVCPKCTGDKSQINPSIYGICTTPPPPIPN
ncbi:MAG: hypothetical protein D4R68_01135 [Ignavibacteriales bacterium]|nr:MAG: hypothetical protein D4R68_01135 [Ignavibacteriales bacterium]